MNNETAQQELELNIKHQNIKPKDHLQVGYEFEEGIYVFLLLLNLKGLKIKGCTLGGEIK